MKNRLQNFLRGGFLSLSLCCVFSTTIFAQHLTFGDDNFKVEAGFNFGPTFFLGDLGGHHGYGTTFLKDLNLPTTKLMKGIFVSAYPNDWLGIRLAAEYTYLEGNDNLITTNGVNELYRKERNLDFKTNVWEAYTALEIFPTMMFRGDDDNYQPKLRPYGFLGVGVFHFNPMGSLTKNGVTTWYYLKPLHTEGEGFAEYPSVKDYNLTQMNIPMGAGLKYFASDRTTISLEFLYRKTFTDYIDDVSTNYVDPNVFAKHLSATDASIARQIYDKTADVLVPGAARFAPGDQRGDPKNTDAYFSILLKFGFRLGDIYGNNSYKDNSGYKNASNKVKCPARF